MANRNRTSPARGQSRRPVADAPQSAEVIPFAPKRIAELVRSPPETDTVALLKRLLQQAHAGELTGLVVVSLHPKQRVGKAYNLSLSGAAMTDTPRALAAMDVCHMLLREIALDDSGIE